ncbi:uncharacterized protein LOC129789183 [Lutzomyia longipalpis]|uniref:uncharacterized protein LOC129789183 n=1 Tax=Lutzomyia longipalpis TaxID=7200 RepID=UPI0024843742|nr:uncharacterized protein LOC129789183 [Lutzomyia longipalpis]
MHKIVLKYSWGSFHQNFQGISHVISSSQVILYATRSSCSFRISGKEGNCVSAKAPRFPTSFIREPIRTHRGVLVPFFVEVFAPSGSQFVRAEEFLCLCGSFRPIREPICTHRGVLVPLWKFSSHPGANLYAPRSSCAFVEVFVPSGSQFVRAEEFLCLCGSFRPIRESTRTHRGVLAHSEFPANKGIA